MVYQVEEGRCSTGGGSPVELSRLCALMSTGNFPFQFSILIWMLRLNMIEPSLVKSVRSLKLPGAATNSSDWRHATVSWLCKAELFASPMLPKMRGGKASTANTIQHPVYCTLADMQIRIFELKAALGIGIIKVFVNLCSFEFQNIDRTLTSACSCCRAKAWTPGESTTLGDQY